MKDNSGSRLNTRNRSVRTYVLRGGRMSRRQQRGYENLRDVYGIRPSERVIDFRELFGNDNPVVLEIGFGNGAATARIAEANVGLNYLGIEVFKAGIGNLLSIIEERGLENVRVIEGDGEEILRRRVPEASLRGVHIFFPDPWPKKKHHKRRLIQPEFLQILTAKLEESGYVYFVTDWEDYALHALELFEAERSLTNRFDRFAPPQEWRPVTRFEEKGLEKRHSIFELLYEKR
ncbi:MAG: tRNA (guanosine(46)-N7)-methyltransferase TrmB [Spirochaetia bacterium]